MSILEVKDLEVSYTIPMGILKALDKVSLTLKRGENLGVAGESGCGKTTLALSIMRLLPKNAIIKKGEIIFNGRNILEIDEKLFRKNISWKELYYIFHGAMSALNPLQKVGNQISEAITLHEKITKAESNERTIDLMNQVGWLWILKGTCSLQILIIIAFRYFMFGNAAAMAICLFLVVSGIIVLQRFLVGRMNEID